jgi:radical SAM protein with 4Fe4S-binding SPASM domain
MHVSPIQFIRKSTLTSVPLTLIPTTIMVYLKTTETCQLDCEHCFTNGKNGKKIYFNPDTTISFFHKLKQAIPNLNGGMITFHGGEPFLAPVQDMRKVWKECNSLWDNVAWSTTTNLVYTLTDDIRSFMKEALHKGISTSWDRGIRFANQKQEDLWRRNLKTLVDDGHNVTLQVSLNRDLIHSSIDKLLYFLDSLEVNYVHFERITLDGNAIQNQTIVPTNQEIDEWFVKLWEATNRIKPRYKDILLDGLVRSIDEGSHTGVRCRDCEQKIFTLNADGSISGCPNSAVGNDFAHINQPIEQILTSPGRINNITCEVSRNPLCYQCDVFDVCNSDCHQLSWQGDICAAPKTLMQQLKQSRS